MINKPRLKYSIIASHAIIITGIYICAIVFPVSSDEPVSFQTRLTQIVLIVLGASCATGLVMKKIWGRLIGIVLYSMLLFQSSKLVVIAFRADRMFVEILMSLLFVLLFCFPLALLMIRDKKGKTTEQKSNMLESIVSWKISPPSDPVELFKSLDIIIPENSTMYFEDVYDNDVKEFLKTISDDCRTILDGGTLWPEPDVYHVSATGKNYRKMQEIAETYPVSVHFHIYRNGVRILEWYDAFEKDSMYVSMIIDEDNIKEFCDRLKLTFRRNKDL